MNSAAAKLKRAPNAVILAAGKSNRLAPFTYERPKGLFRVRGEILIERQIRQLQEAGVRDIYVVVGYMKEKFFYLEETFGVKLIVNNRFAAKGNILSLYAAREHLADTFVCCADHYFTENLFLQDNPDNVSYRACAYCEGKFREFSVECSDADVITGFSVGGTDQVAMVGHAYFNSSFSSRLRAFMEAEINDFRVDGLFWEEFYARHQKSLTLYARRYDGRGIWEFDSIDELRRFDSEFLLNVDSRIITNICQVLHCHPNSIVDIAVIQAGLTNVSFSFKVDGVKYVYRHPGSTAGHLIDRESELFAQTKAIEQGVDKSVIRMDPSGWKISYFVPDIVECSFAKYPEQLAKAMEYLRRIHSVPIDGPVKDFDLLAEGKKLMAVASAAKGDLFSEFAPLLEKVERLDGYLKEDAERLGIKRVLCHNDVYEPNYIVSGDGEMYLIDWEYAGLNDPANDVDCILCRYHFSDEEIEAYLRAYFDRELTADERRHYIAHIALSGFYWFCWGLYKGSVGDDDGFFFLPAYRSCIRFLDPALASFERAGGREEADAR